MYRTPVLLFTVLAGSCVVAGEPDFPTAEPVMRIHLNLLQLKELAKSFEATWRADQEQPELFDDFGDVLNGETPQPGWQVMYQIDLLANAPGYLIEMLLPQKAAVMEEYLNEVGLPASALQASGQHVVTCALSSLDAEDQKDAYAILHDAYRNNMDQTLEYISRDPLRSVVRLDVLPANLLRTHARDRIRGVLASASTMAQQRDGESTADHALRAAAMQLAVDAGQSCLKDLSALRVEMGRGSASGEIEVQVSARAKKDSQLHRRFEDLRKTRNRSVSWLHPAHTGFLTVSLPFPQNVAEMLSARGNLQGVSEILGRLILSLELMPLAQLVDSRHGPGKLELLIQTLPCSDESTAVIWIWPGPAETAEAIRQVNWKNATPMTVAGYPAWQEDGLKVGDVSMKLTVVETEQCVAAVIGTNAALEMLVEVLRRDFKESATARRHTRSVLAADLPLNDPVLQEFQEYGDLMPPVDDEQTVEARLKIETFPEGRALTTTLSFQKHATVVGMKAMDELFIRFNQAFDLLAEE